MQPRLLPKPRMPRKRERLEAVSSFLRQHEATILSLSVLLSAIGLIVAGSSAWLAWHQVSIMANERATPFKSAMYAERINAIHENALAKAKFETSALCVRTIVITEIQFGRSMERRRECIKSMQESLDGVDFTMRPSISIWNQQTRVAVAKYVAEASNLNLCASKWLLIGDREVLGLDLSGNCPKPFDFKSEYKSLQNLGVLAEGAMMLDLNALAKGEK
jgi:hypothetical protein